MSSKAEKERQKILQDKCQSILNELLRDEDNKYCVDCDSKGPRWASWNLGIFLCIRCAGIHRNLGVHISKVKSVNLDSWTPEQVVNLQQMGNSRARAVYEANLPDTFRRPQHDSSLEGFIRAKYEQKKYIAKEWVPPPIPKVNWDKEIEESRKKKDGKRKVTATSALPIPTADLQSVPKPKSPNSTPKPVRAADTLAALENAENKNSNPVTSSAAIDLLGLDTPSAGQSEGADDIFTNFLSASGKTETANITGIDPHKRSEEEDNFFNQPAPNAQDKKPLSKDSILALYSQGTPQQQQQPPQQFGVQGGIFAHPVSGFPNAQPNMGFPAMQQFQPMHQMQGISNGMMAMPSMPQFGGQTSSVAANPFFASGMPAANPQAFQPNMQPSQDQDLMLDFGNPLPTSQQPQQLTQQMGRMNLGSVAPPGMMGPSNPVLAPNNGFTLSSNLWQ